MFRLLGAVLFGILLGSCGGGGEKADIGEVCEAPGDSSVDLPVCKAGLDCFVMFGFVGDDIQIDSYCTMECESEANCQDDFPGGCCYLLFTGPSTEKTVCVDALTCEDLPADKGGHGW